MNTESLDLQEYFDNLDERVKKNNQFEHLFLKYKEHLESVAVQHNVLNRTFYLIIPERADITIQISICQKKLDAIGLKSTRLKDEQLKEIITRFFSSKKGSLLPEKIENFPSYVKIDKTFSRIIESAFVSAFWIQLGYQSSIPSCIFLQITNYSFITCFPPCKKSI